MKPEKKIKNLSKKFFLDLLKLKREFHQYPELAYNESEDGTGIGFPEPMPCGPPEADNSRSNERY